MVQGIFPVTWLGMRVLCGEEIMGRALDRIVELLAGILTKLGYLALMFTTLIVFVAVVLRYGIGISFGWLEELAKQGILAMVFFVVGVLALRGEHMRFTFIRGRFTGRKADYLSLLAFSLGLACGVLLTIGSYHLVAAGFDTGAVTEEGVMKWWIFHSFMLFGFVLLSVFYLYLLGVHIVRMFNIGSKPQEQ